MEISLIESVLKVCKVLNTHSVEYLVVGGTAVALHGHYRQSLDPSGQLMEKHDLDFWYNPTYDNYFSVLNALEELGLEVTEFRKETAPDPKRSFFKLEEENFKIDLLPELPGLSKFRSSFKNRAVAQIHGIEIPYLNSNDLIESKRALARPKDAEDIARLNLKRDKPT